MTVAEGAIRRSTKLVHVLRPCHSQLYEVLNKISCDGGKGHGNAIVVLGITTNGREDMVPVLVPYYYSSIHPEQPGHGECGRDEWAPGSEQALGCSPPIISNHTLGLHRPASTEKIKWPCVNSIIDRYMQQS